MKKFIIPIYVQYTSNKKDWIFDNQKIANDKKELTKEKLKCIIQSNISKIKERSFIEVAFVGADFTNLSEDLQIELLETLQQYIQDEQINSIRVSIRPNNITKSKLKMLKKYKVKAIELEVHSTNDYILKHIGMDYTFKDIKKASKMIRLRGFKLGHQMTIGLPESTKIDDINTAKNLVKLRPSMVSINPVLVIKNTPLEKEFQGRAYKPLAVIQAIETCKELVKIFNQKNIEITAIGFDPLDSEVKQETFAEQVIAGPFHPEFRQLVESSLWYDVIVNKIKMLNTKVMQVEVTINPEDVNNVIGYKNENIEKLKDTYDVELIVTPAETMKQGKSKIDITKIFGWGE